MNLTKELQEELIQVANGRAGYELYGLDHKTDHMKLDLFRHDVDGYEDMAVLLFAISVLIGKKQYAITWIKKQPSYSLYIIDILKADITALENLLEEVQL